MVAARAGTRHPPAAVAQHRAVARMQRASLRTSPSRRRISRRFRRRKRGSRECGGDAGARDWCRETVFPELYFGGLVEALEEHMANGDLVFPEGK